MCPICYASPLLVSILSAIGLTSVHIWMDENPFLSGMGTVIGLLALSWGLSKLYKYFSKGGKN
jgi:hypothetical protein